MTPGVVLLGLVLAADPRPPPAALAPPARAPAQATCLRYRVQAEKNDLVPEAEAAGWASAALERAGLHDPRSPCYVLLRITAGPTRSRGVEDGWVAHVALSTRRLQKDGKLVSRERGRLFIEAEREAIVARVRALVEEFVAAVAAPAQPGRPGSAFPEEH